MARAFCYGVGQQPSRTPCILAASNADLAHLVDAGRFRADLHFRLDVMDLPIPPLRMRETDAVLLARHFIAEAACRYCRPTGASASTSSKPPWLACRNKVWCNDARTRTGTCSIRDSRAP